MQHEQQERSLEGSFIKSHGASYGKLIILANNSCLHLSIGPKYSNFLITLFATLIYSAATLYLLMRSENNSYICIILSVLPTASFLFTSLTDPGVYNSTDNTEPTTKYCSVCKVFKPRGVYHCYTCDVCVEGYYHHCAWISKCIGRRNIFGYYIYIGSVPIGIVLFCVLLLRGGIN